MKIITLIDDKTNNENLKSEHGLCFYIETENHKLLFDVGASDLFLDNAKILGTDISEIDTVIISHGHNDHGGGLREFLNYNDKALIYINKNAFGDYYSLKNKVLYYIGLDKSLKDNERICFTSDYFKIDNELELFSNVKGRELMPYSNNHLLEKVNGKYVKDSFCHEQNLIINSNDKTVLITGCAHNGIVNIYNYCEKLKGKQPNCVLGGFHLTNPKGNTENEKLIDAVGDKLLNTNSKFYTCHCTEQQAFDKLKKILAEKTEYLNTGNIIKI